MKRKTPKRDARGRFVSSKRKALPRRDTRGRFLPKAEGKSRKPTEGARLRKKIRELEKQLARAMKERDSRFVGTAAWARYVKDQPRNVRAKVEPLLALKDSGNIDPNSFHTAIIEAGLSSGIAWALWYSR